jgi:3-deoxy-D-manno-octulosonic-acid transferase
LRDRRYFKGLRERLGFLPSSLQPTTAGSIWFHAVSVGEVLSTVELLRALKAERPRIAIYLSMTTLAGRAMAEERLQGLADHVFFAPIDYRSCVRRVLRRIRPSLVVIMETEIWPNLYREAKRAGASLVVVNGRISEQALPSYQKASAFFTHVLRWPDSIFVQTGDDAKRYVVAGAPAIKVKSVGNLKFDFRPPEAGIAAEIARFLGDERPVWIAASTMPPTSAEDVDEDDVVIAAFQQLAENHPDLMLVLVPRKPERFDTVAKKLEAAQIQFVRRSELVTETGRVLLLDTIGELAGLYDRASVVFMGGTLTHRGGHNILEAAYFGKPVIAGPHMENFAEIAREFTNAGALERIPDSVSLAGAVDALLTNTTRAAEIGDRAQRLAMSKRGVVSQLTKELFRAVGEAVPDPPRTLASRYILGPLSLLWLAGHRFNVARMFAGRKSLSTRVVSIGGLNMGGSGKTPMVEHIARRLYDAGKNPAILTRGYRKKSPSRIVVVPRGQSVSLTMTGDEAQMFVRSGVAHVGIGGSRFEVGQRMERELHPDVFLLDDGFQHIWLNRDEDIVLIDALNPLAGGLFPLGRRREPLESLARATAIVITRVDAERGVAGLERLIRRYNRKAPIFRSRVAPREWVDLEQGATRALEDPPFRRVAAFCGLGSPGAFWKTLEDLGLEIVFRCAFRDHHSYRATDVRRLAEQARAAGAEALVTTEKDTMNLKEGAVEMAAPQKIYWLKIGVEIDREDELMSRIL